VRRAEEKFWNCICGSKSTVCPLADLSRSTVSLITLALAEADVSKISSEANLIIKQQNIVIEREQYL